jgi:death on curing protein
VEIYFLTLNDVLEIHIDQINRYGGERGIRDLGFLLSAIAQPSSTFNGQDLHTTLYDKAGAYLYHICQNHPFIDGNKRAALVSSLMFLAMNNCPFDYQEAPLEQLVLELAQGKIKKDAIATFVDMRG